MKSILITGGAGFIGFFLAKHLVNVDDYQIYLIDDLSRGKMDRELAKLIKKDNVHFLKGDLTNPETYTQLEIKFDQIYHLAAVVGVNTVMNDPVRTIRTNSLSTLYLLDYIKNLTSKPKILFTSSCENYAGSVKNCNLNIPTPENVPLCIEDVKNPRWTYAASKILGEIACIQYANFFNFKCTIIRYHNIYGPRMGYQHVIPDIALRMLENSEKIEIFGGYQYRTFCYISDAVAMTAKLMELEETNNLIVNVGNDTLMIKISSLVTRIANFLKISPEIIEKGAPEGSIDKRKPDLELIKSLDCYSAEVEIEEGIERTLNWYQRN